MELIQKYLSIEKIRYEDQLNTHIDVDSESLTLKIPKLILEEDLPSNFIRINKSTIANLDFISELILHKSSSKIVFPSKVEIHISEKYLEKFQNRLENLKH